MQNFRISLGITSLALIALTSACKTGSPGVAGSGGASSADKIVQPLADRQTIIEYNGGKITAADVNASVAPQLKQFNEQAIEAYKRGAERILVTRLVEAEAKKQGLAGPDALISQIAGTTIVTDDQVKAFMKANDLEKGFKDPHTGKRKAVSKDDVKKFLGEQERQNKQQQFLQGLMASANPKTLLEEARVDVKVDPSAPSLGSPAAKVVIEEFSDFQCPYCSKAHETVTRIVQTYGDKIYLQYRHFPLPPESHPEAKNAAIASVCAQQQGKFWPMHDKLFDKQRELSPDNYKKWAGEVGANPATFATCLTDPNTVKTVEKDQADAEKLGVNSTPTFFINGKKIAGAVPFEQFKNMIDGELAKK